MNPSGEGLAPGQGQGDAADHAALDRILAVRPAWSGLERARDALGLEDRRLLHAGPPLADPNQASRPLLNSAITAILFERWASSAQEAEQLIRSGDVSLHAAQDVDCVVPLADVVSASMWLQVVTDLRGASATAYSPLNGGADDVMRVGVLGTRVLDHLRWMNGPFAQALRQALNDPISLIELADIGLSGGDDCHGKTASATQALVRLLPFSADSSAVQCHDFLRTAPGFFLNLWMAATKCMLNAATGIAGASVVTAAAGNGTDFGIQVGGLPGRWFAAPADAPAFAPADARSSDPPLGAIGDSAVVDFLGLGAMTSFAARPQPEAPFKAVYPDSVQAPRDLLACAHPGFHASTPLVGVTARRVAAAGQTPIVGLGALDKNGRMGRLAGGFYRPPVHLFTTAVANLQA